MPASPPDSRARSHFSAIGLLLFGTFIAAVLIAGLCTQNWVKRLDQPPPGIYRVIAGAKSAFFLKLTHQSIKGLHHTNGIRGHLEIPGETTPRPLAISDTTSTEWQNKIKTPQFLSAAPSVANIESNIVLLLETRIPDDPLIVGKTVPVTFFIDMVIPRVDPQNLKAGMEVPLKDSWTVQAQVMPPGYRRIYQRTGHGALAVAGVTLALILVRQSLRRRRSPGGPPTTGA